MLLTKLLHPEILGVLAKSGHGSKILITDGNFPVMTKVPAQAAKVFLNLTPDMVKVTDVLSVLSKTIPIESAEIMMPPDSGQEPQIHSEFKTLLENKFEFTKSKKSDFYKSVETKDICIAIVTADRRRFANILITIGVA